MAKRQTQRTNVRLKEARQRREKKVSMINEIKSATPIQEKKTELKNPRHRNKSNGSKKIRKPSTKSLALATKQLASMVKTGLPIVEALNLVADTTDDKSLKVAFSEIADGIAKGNTIVEMLEKYPMIFDEMYIALADAGEQAGLLAEVLEREATLLETLSKLQAQIKSAMTYPIAIGILVVVVVIIMLVFVIPIFVDMYKSSGSDLPALTQFLVDASEWLRKWQNLLTLCATIYASIRLIKFGLTKESFVRLIDKVALKIPAAGELITKSNLANFARTLSSLNSAGVPLVESIKISKRTLGNSQFRDIVERMQISILAGEPIYKSLSEETLIPRMFSSMFRIGEETGELSGMVDKLADFYEDEVSTSVKSLTSILEPMMIVVVAGVVAVILVAMYLPMFNMMSTVK